jgi:hypothetical protein
MTDVVEAVIQRQRSVHPAVEAIAEPTLAAAAVFSSTYDAARTQQPHTTREITELEGALATLRRTTQAWMGPLASAVPTISVSDFANADRTPKGIIADAKRMLELVRAYQAEANEPLPFAEALIADLSAKVEIAEKEYRDMGELTSSQAELRNEARIAARKLHRQLVGLRRSLRAVLGRSHPDYRALRTQSRSTQAEQELDDDQDAEIDNDLEDGNAPDTPILTESAAE